MTLQYPPHQRAPPPTANGRGPTLTAPLPTSSVPPPAPYVHLPTFSGHPPVSSDRSPVSYAGTPFSPSHLNHPVDPLQKLPQDVAPCHEATPLRLSRCSPALMLSSALARLHLRHCNNV